MSEQGTLHDAFLDELRDAYDAEKQLLRALPKLAKRASSPKLRDAFESHLKETKGQVEKLEREHALVRFVDEWEAPDRILLAWQLSADFAYDPELITEVDLVFHKEGDGTRVECEHRHAVVAIGRPLRETPHHDIVQPSRNPGPVAIDRIGLLRHVCRQHLL